VLTSDNDGDSMLQPSMHLFPFSRSSWNYLNLRLLYSSFVAGSLIL